jgi:hypothetical protein
MARAQCPEAMPLSGSMVTFTAVLLDRLIAVRTGARGVRLEPFMKRADSAALGLGHGLDGLGNWSTRGLALLYTYDIIS